MGASRPAKAVFCTLLLALNSLSELPLVGPLSGAKQTPLWQSPETGFDPKRILNSCRWREHETPGSR
jgi:hypothetical protein